ncbi:Ig-like domain-containing protein, partial [Bacteroidales bacterium OttesenSCG-928-E04]|nr:Ig-like domain-containing protein [Bacteroidales bacterium OttesenSCG-928-E04]
MRLPCGTSGGSISVRFIDDTPKSYTIKGETENIADAATSLTIDGLATGTYNILFTYEDGCTYELNNIEIGVNSDARIKVGSIYVLTQPTCSDSTGSIQLVVTGGSGRYVYNFDNSATRKPLAANGTIDKLPVGNYTVYVWDEEMASCAAAISNTVKLSPATNTLNIVATTEPANSCTGEDGKILIRVTGGNGKVQYRINNTGSYLDIPSDGYLVNKRPGEYTIAVRDADNCISTTKAVVLTEGSDVDLSLVEVKAANCDTVGELQIKIAPDVAGLTWHYQLDGRDWRPFINNKATESVTAGMHQVLVRNKQNCYASGEITIANGSTLNAKLGGTITSLCEGTNDGGIRITIEGGTAPYSITNGANINETVDAAGTHTITGLSAGTYQLTVTDHADCIAVVEKIVIEREINVVQAIDNRIQVYKNQTAIGNVLYDDYEYNRGPITLISNTNTSHGNLTLTMSNGNFVYVPSTGYVGKDTAQYTIQNACGFTSTASLYIEVIDTMPQANRPPIAMNDYYKTKMNVPLNAFEVRTNDLDPDGDVLAMPSTIVNVTHGILTQAVSGTYTYTPNTGFVGVDEFMYKVCDPGGLCDTAKVFITVYSEEIYKDSIVALPDNYTVAKYDTLIVSTPATSILNNDIWPDPENGAIIAILEDVKHGTLDVNTTDGTFRYVPDEDYEYAGPDYFVYQLCTGYPEVSCDTAYVHIFISDRECIDPVSLVLTDTLRICMGDSVDIRTAVDFDMSRNIDTVFYYADREYTNKLTSIFVKSTGYYYVEARNIYECSEFDSVYVTTYYQAVAADITTKTDTVCKGSAATLSASSSIPGVEYRWYTSNDPATIPVVTTSEWTTGALISDTTFYVSIHNDTICENAAGALKAVHVKLSIPQFGFTDEDTINLCYGTTIDLNDYVEMISAGDLYFLQVNEDGTATRVTDLVLAIEDTTTFKIYAVSDLDCMSEDTLSLVFNTSRFSLGSVTEVTQPSCADQTGSVKIVINGGSGNYLYNTTDDRNSATSLASTGIIGGLPVGKHTFYIWDRNADCSPLVSNEITLTANDNTLQLTVETTDANTCGDNGSITIYPAGGTGTLQYAVNGSAYSNVPSNGFIGNNYATNTTHVIQIKDEKNCVISDSVKIYAVDADIDLSLRVMDTAQCAKKGKIEIKIDPEDSGSWEYRLDGLSWTNFNGDTVAEAFVDAGLRVVELRNPMNSCYTKDSILVVNKSGLDAQVTGSTPAICAGEAGGKMVLSISGGASPYTITDGNLINISDATSPVTITGLVKGSYNITVKDQNGCIYTIEDVVVDEAMALTTVADYNHTYKNESVVGNVLSNDLPSSPELRLMVSGYTQGAQGSTITIAANGAYTYTPALDFVGNDTVIYTATIGNCDLQRGEILIIHVLDLLTVEEFPPFAQDDSYTTLMDSTIKMPVLYNDRNSTKEPLGIPTIVDSTAHGTLTVNLSDSTITYKPYSGYVGVDYFTYSICNEFGLCDTAHVAISISKEIEAVFAITDYYTTKRTQKLIVDAGHGLLQNDIYPSGTTSVSVIAYPAKGTLSSVEHDGSFTYTPFRKEDGADYFIYELCVDGSGARCDTAYAHIFIYDGGCTPVDFIVECDNDTTVTIAFGEETVTLDTLYPLTVTIDMDVDDEAKEELMQTLVIHNNAPADLTFAYGQHKVTWYVEDECGTIDSCIQWVVVNRAPCEVDTLWDIVEGVPTVVRIDTIYAVDAEGNQYRTVRICGECWTAENLRSTLYSDSVAVESRVYEARMYPN